MIKLTKAQHIALGNYLTEYPSDLSFRQILSKIANNGESDSDIVIAEAYEDINNDDLSCEIDSLANQIQRAIDDEVLKNKIN